jgi:TrpR-related protein YerC/YecD
VINYEYGFAAIGAEESTVRMEDATRMESKMKDLNVEFLFQAVLKLESMEECYKFFGDLCTINELRSISQRLVVAKMLDDRKVYSDIVAQTGASTATISRVNRSLNYGNDGYRVIFDRLEDKPASDN